MGSREHDSAVAQRVLITGGASGIGEACCRMFAANGAFVVIADSNVQAAIKLVEDLERHGTAQGRVKFIEVDVTSWESQIRLFDRSLEFFPAHELDVLITSAGVKGSPSWETKATNPSALKDDAALTSPSTKCLDVGLFGSMYSAHIATTYGMGLHNADLSTQQRQSKSIILIGSSAGYRHLPGRPDYTALKWGIRGLFRSLRHELFSSRVRVNLLAPTFVSTPMIADRLPGMQERGVKLAQMEDVLAAVELLATDPACVGRALCVTGNGVQDLCDDLEGFDGGKMHSVLVDQGSLGPLPPFSTRGGE